MWRPAKDRRAGAWVVSHPAFGDLRKRNHTKRVPVWFKTEAAAQRRADRLNARDGGAGRNEKAGV